MAGQERIFHEILSQSSPPLPFQGISQSWSISLYCNAWTPFFGLRTQRSRLSNDRLEGTKHLEVSLFDRLTGRQAWKFLDVCSNMFQLDGVYGLPRWIPCCVRHSEASSCRSCALSFHESLCLTEYGRHGSWIMSPQNAQLDSIHQQAATSTHLHVLGGFQILLELLLHLLRHSRAEIQYSALCI